MEIRSILKNNVDIFNLEISEDNLEYYEILANGEKTDFYILEEKYSNFFSRINIFDSIECFYLFNHNNANMLFTYE